MHQYLSENRHWRNLPARKCAQWERHTSVCLNNILNTSTNTKRRCRLCQTMRCPFLAQYLLLVRYKIKSLHLSYCKSSFVSQLLTVTYTNPRKNYSDTLPVSPAFWVQTKKIALTSYRKNRYYLHLPPLLQTMVIDRWKSLSHLMTIQHLQTSHHWNACLIHLSNSSTNHEQTDWMCVVLANTIILVLFVHARVCVWAYATIMYNIFIHNIFMSSFLYSCVYVLSQYSITMLESLLKIIIVGIKF